MPAKTSHSSKPLLNRMDRISEVLFGLVMVLTITCSFSVGGAGRSEVRQMLMGALGCNLAWGIVDAIMYLMACLGERGQGIIALRAVRKAADPRQAHRMIAEAMPPLLASVVPPAALEAMRLDLNRLPEPPERARLTKHDWLASLGIFLLVLGATFPVALPFILVSGTTRALRTSNGIAIGMLFLTGFAFGRHAGHHPWAMGLTMVLVGSAMVGVTIALGG
jgi:VIT family protein